MHRPTMPAALRILLACALLGACDQGGDAGDGKAKVAAADEPAPAPEPEPEPAPEGEAHDGGGDAKDAAEETTASEAAAADAPEPDDDADEDASEGSGDAAAVVEKTASTSAKKPDAKPSKKEPASKPASAKGNDGPSTGLTLAQGKEIYTKRCRSCHGTTGAADTKMGKQHDIPAWTEAGWKSKWPLAKIKEITANGKAGTKMKAFSDKLSPDEIEIVSKYALSLGK